MIYQFEAIKRLRPDSIFRVEYNEDENATVIWDESNSDEKPTDAEIAESHAVIEAEVKLQALRYARNALLKETDWWALSDCNMTPEQAEYRQKLRDITKTYSSMTDSGFSFPTKPE